MKLVKQFTQVLLITLALIQGAWAVSLDEAKASGWVGERYTGYLGIVSNKDKVIALVKDVNNKRKLKYGKLAVDNGIPLEEVEKLAGKKVISKTKPGHYIDQGNGWVIK